MIYMDIDGTLTDRQKRWAKPIPERINRVKAMIAAGENVIVWSGTYRYAREWCDRNGFTGKYEPYAVMPKPKYFVDNQSRVRSLPEGGGKILGRRTIITPEAFMELTQDEFGNVDKF